MIGTVQNLSHIPSGDGFGLQLADGAWCGMHRIERLVRLQALEARERRLPPNLGERRIAAVAANVLDRSFAANAPIANGLLTLLTFGQRS
jgi:hypothetical protein